MFDVVRFGDRCEPCSELSTLNARPWTIAPRSVPLARGALRHPVGVEDEGKRIPVTKDQLRAGINTLVAERSAHAWFNVWRLQQRNCVAIN